VVWFGLMRRYAAEGAPEVGPAAAADAEDDAPLTFAY
jgi:hypothetical protein